MAVTSRSIFASNWQSELAAAWAESITVLRQENPQENEPERWPGYEIKKARLANMGSSLRTVLAAFPTGALLLPEERLASPTTPLRGVVDLIVRSGASSLIVDYKTGTVHDPDSREPRSAYSRQMQLYAFLESEASGKWPDRAVLIPARGEPVDVAVEPQDCMTTVGEVLAVIGDYNARVPNPQPAAPSPASCRYCNHAFDCDAFWALADTGDLDEIGPLRGTVLEIGSTPLGGYSVVIEPNGSDRTPIHLSKIAAVTFPAIDQASPGDTVAIVGLRSVADDGVATLRREARLVITRSRNGHNGR